jgi:hypothetical protein
MVGRCELVSNVTHNKGGQQQPGRPEQNADNARHSVDNSSTDKVALKVLNVDSRKKLV